MNKTISKQMSVALDLGFPYGDWYTLYDSPFSKTFFTIIVSKNDRKSFYNTFRDIFEIYAHTLSYNLDTEEFKDDVLKGHHKNKKIMILLNSESSRNIINIRINIIWDANDVTKQDIKEVISNFSKYRVFEEKVCKVNIIVQESGDYELYTRSINPPTIDIELNYGKEFAKKHDYILNRLNDSDSPKGIVLLHGLHGTGKTMYIRYLASLLSENKKLIYIPSHIAANLSDPSLLSFMTRNSNSILIIEDAENILKSREYGGSAVDKILNLSDGLLSDVLNTQIICTFNSDHELIDEALMRKGRLIVRHKFDRLNIDNGKQLASKLNIDPNKVNKEMTLAEIYNIDDEYVDSVKTENKLGFTTQ